MGASQAATESPESQERKGAPAAWRFAAAFAAMIVILFVAGNIVAKNLRILGLRLPDYSIWAGVPEVEQKLRLLEKLAAEGPVDALVLSSSMGDLGISAETLTREMSARLGRPYRVFNFSMGGADIPTYPMLYRLARSVARPREVWLVAPVSVPRKKASPGTLDAQLLDGPIGRYDRIPGGIRLSREFHELPLIRFAPAIRDMIVYQPLRHRPASNLDLYDIDDHGDTVSWMYNVQLYELGKQLNLDRRWELERFTNQPNDAQRAKHDRIYFDPRALAFMRELRDMLRADGVALKIVAFDHAVALGMRDNEFLDASRRYYDRLSGVLEAPVVDVRREFELAPYMISDITHLNAIGAREFSRVLAARMAGASAAPVVRYEVTEKIRYRLPDPTWAIFDALVPRRAGDPSAALELRYLQNWGVSPLPVTSEVAVEVRLPDGRDVTLPTRLPARGLVIADTSSLALAGRDVVLRVRLVLATGNVGAPLSQPLQSFEWR